LGGGVAGVQCGASGCVLRGLLSLRSTPRRTGIRAADWDYACVGGGNNPSYGCTPSCTQPLCLSVGCVPRGLLSLRRASRRTGIRAADWDCASVGGGNNPSCGRTPSCTQPRACQLCNIKKKNHPNWSAAFIWQIAQSKFG
jgi:hypothetical protein